MGNACTASSVVVCETSNNKDPVIVLQANGEVMKINRKIRAGELMADYPQHFLCHASTILLRRKSKMIPAKALLQGGKIYLLLPFPASSSSENTPSGHPAAAKKDEEQSEEKNPLLRVETNATQGTTKFVISKHYLERILSEKQKPRKCARRSTTPTTSKKAKRSSGKENAPLERRSSITWSPALESIPESPLK